jgi:D-sedoheptulose 7-phosphate isomerase
MSDKMDIKEFAKNYLSNINRAISEIDLDKIQTVAQVIYNAYKNDKQIFIIGNGGSASTASHFACDLGKGTVKDFSKRQKRFRVFSLTDNVATLMAFGNDLSFDKVFSEQLKNLINAGDLVIGISASGNSPNVVKAIEYAKSVGAKTVGLLGFTTGGKLKRLVDFEITVQDNHYGRSEDIHLIIVHLISNYFTELLNHQES